MWYKIDFKRLALLMLPTFLRKPLITALLGALIAPIQAIYNRFTAYRETISRRLDFTGETQHLEKILNDEFALTDKIFITNINSAAGKVILSYKKEVQHAVNLYYASSEDHVVLVESGTERVHANFIVNIPVLLNTGENVQKIRRIVDYYKMAGKQYKIKTYE